MLRLAIIGAGAAGLAAARALRQRRPGLAVDVFEKSRGLGGRVATRRRDGFAFDHGAQLFKTPTPALERLVRQELPDAGLRSIGPPVWTFDAAGQLAEGDPQQNDEPRLVYGPGINQLGKLLAEGVAVRREARVAALRREGASWALADAAGAVLGRADLVLLTPPAPQAAELLAASDLAGPPREALLAELGRARYRRCISLALAYARPLDRPFYALVSRDRAHPVAWLALEHAKGPERCPPGHSLLLAQMAPQWSLDHWDTPDGELVGAVAAMAEALLGEPLGAPLWCDTQRWRYALPDAGADFDTLNRAEPTLLFAGDYTAGQGRVHLAIESGWRAAQLAEERLDAWGA